MKKLLLSLSVALSLNPGIAAQEIFEQDNLYYSLMNPEDSLVNVVANPDGSQYTGDITIVPSVTYNNKTYTVFVNSFFSVFTNSTIENFTVGEGFNDESKLYQVQLINDNALQTVTLKSFVSGNQLSTPTIINVGNNPGCAYLNMRSDGDKNYIVIDKFNVYGPDGERLKPFLHIDGMEFDDPESKIYPDENGIFTLDAGWKYNNNYCCVLPMQSYFVVLLYVEYEGKYACIRCQPEPHQTGLYTEHEGIRYMVMNGSVAVADPEEGTYSGNITIPESVPYESQNLPVTLVTRKAFSRSDVSSLTLPSSVYEMETFSFELCKKLERVDLSATKIKDLNTAFYFDSLLSEVSLPDSLEIMRLCFSNCPELSEIRIPRGCYLSSPFTNCPRLVDVQIASNDSVQASVQVNLFNIQDMDGNVLPYWVHGYSDKIIYPETDGDIYTFNKQDFYYHPWEWNPDYTGYAANVYLEFDSEESDYLAEGSTFYFVYIPEKAPEPSAVESVATDYDADAPVVFYNLNGLQVNGDTLTPGIYIRRQGNKTTKILVK